MTARATAGGRPEFGLYLPQLAFTYDVLEDRALRMEAAGVDTMWLFDHVYGPNLPGVDALEGWTTATALLCKTTRLHVGHLVLCANFRHPALLAKMIATLDVISGGRFELGLGTGSYPREHDEAGLPFGPASERNDRMIEVLEIITRMLRDGIATFDGRYFQVHDVPCLPSPVHKPWPRLHIGGIGPRFTIPTAARFADVWNVPTYAVGRAVEGARQLDAECERIGREPATVARSIQSVMVLVDNERDLPAALATAERRYGGPGFSLAEGGFIGTPDMVVRRIREFQALGFDQFVFFMADRGDPVIIDLFGREVVGAFGP